MRQGTRLRDWPCLLLAAVTAVSLAAAGAANGADAPPVAPAAPAVPAVLDMVPANSQMIFLVPNLLVVSQKVSMLNESLGLSLPWMNDALGEVKRATGMNAGVKNDGSLALVGVSLAGRADGLPGVVLLVPVSDYEAFIAGIKGKASEPVTQVTLKSGHQAYARHVEGFAVLGPRQELVEGFKPEDQAAGKLAQKIGKEKMDCMIRSDMALFLDLPGAEPLVRSQMESILAAVPGYLQVVTGMGPLGQVLSKAAVNIGREAATAQTRDAVMAVMGMDVDELGLGMTSMVQYKPDSAMAKMLAGTGPAKNLLAHLPGQAYMLAYTADLRVLKLGPLLDNAQEALPRQQLGWLADLIRGAKPLADAATSVGMVYYTPPGGLAASPLVGVNVVGTDDPKGFVEAFKTYLQHLNAGTVDLSAMAVPAVDGKGPAPVASFTNQYNSNAQVIEGVSVDQYEMHCDVPLSVVSQLGSGGAMITLGLMSQRGYVVAMDKAVIITTTTDRQMLTQALAAYRGVGTLDQNVRQIRDRLSANPAAEGYANISPLAQSVVSFLSAVASSPPTLQVPQDLPPVAWSLSVQDQTVTKRLFLPIPVVKFSRDLYHTLQAMMPAPGTPATPAGTPGVPRR